jgi:hypothetical protein
MKRLTFILSTSVFISLCGCAESPIRTVDRSSNCSDICERYKVCVSTDYNTEKCKDRCTDMKDSKGTEKVDHCEKCIEENSCGGSVFKCGGECAGIVP